MNRIARLAVSCSCTIHTQRYTHTHTRTDTQTHTGTSPKTLICMWVFHLPTRTEMKKYRWTGQRDQLLAAQTYTHTHSNTKSHTHTLTHKNHTGTSAKTLIFDVGVSSSNTIFPPFPSEGLLRSCNGLSSLREKSLTLTCPSWLRTWWCNGRSLGDGLAGWLAGSDF